MCMYVDMGVTDLNNRPSKIEPNNVKENILSLVVYATHHIVHTNETEFVSVLLLDLPR